LYFKSCVLKPMPCREKFIARADLARAIDRGVMAHTAAVTEFDPGGDNGVGADLHARTEWALDR